MLGAAAKLLDTFVSKYHFYTGNMPLCCPEPGVYWDTVFMACNTDITYMSGRCVVHLAVANLHICWEAHQASTPAWHTSLVAMRSNDIGLGMVDCFNCLISRAANSSITILRHTHG